MKVLLVRPDGIGDEILCLPVASALRRLLPDAQIVFLSSEYAAPVLAHHPDLDEVWTVTGRESLGELVDLFRRSVDAVVFLKPFKRLMWAAFLAQVPMQWRRVTAGIVCWRIVGSMNIGKIFPSTKPRTTLVCLRGLGCSLTACLHRVSC